MSEVEQDRSRGLKSYSCLTCRQRKVKCDRRSPCSNCMRANSQCSFVAPVRGKRKRTKPQKEGLHTKLKRYEELLRSYGAKIEPSEHDDDSNEELDSAGDTPMTEDTRSEVKIPGMSVAPEEIKPRFVIKDGSSRYFDTALWSSMGGDSRHPEEAASTESEDESENDQDDLFVDPLGTTPASNLHGHTENFAALLPPLQLLSDICEIYQERIDPLTKVLHLPTFRSSLADAIQRPQSVPKSLKAVILAFRLIVIAASREDECHNMLGEQKSTVFTRYRLAARRALLRAGLLDTSNPETLQAYIIFMAAVRKCHRIDTVFVMSGIAVRLARRMGLHRDGSSLGLSPFETEKVTWRWCFYINLPVGAISVIVTVFILHVHDQKLETPAAGWMGKVKQLDPIGNLVFFPGIICLVLALQWGGTKYSWSNARIIVLLVLFAVLCSVFVAIQIWKQESGTVPPRIVKQRSIAASTFFTFFNGSGMMVMVYYLPIYFQAIKGVSAIKSGIMILPTILAVVVGSISSGILVSKIGYTNPFFILSSITTSIGAGLICLLTPTSGHAQWIGYQILFGLGLGFGSQQPLTVAQTVLDRKDIATGSALIMFMRFLGPAIFLSVAQNIFVNGLVSKLTNLPGIDVSAVTQGGATNLRNLVSGDDLTTLLSDYNTAIVHVFYLVAATCSITIIGSVLVEWRSLKARAKEQEGQAVDGQQIEEVKESA